MDKIPTQPLDITKLLYEQVALLIEKSRDCDVSEIRANIQLLADLQEKVYPIRD